MAGLDNCPVCGSKIGEGAEACGVCGTAFDAIPPKCPLCGSEVNEFVTECPNCGAEMEGQHEQIPDTVIDEVEIAEMPSEAEKETAELIASDVFVDVELEELVKLSGVGPLKAKILYDAGFTDLRKLKQASVVELMNIRGIGRKAAGEIKTALRESSLEEIRETAITKETVEAEYQCPLCETIVSAYESSCYECGCIFEPGTVSDADSDRLALSYYDSKLLREPDNKDLWYARGATLVKMEEYDQALNSFNRSLEIDKSFQSAWMSKAEVYNKLGDSTKAAECYSHIISSASGTVFGQGQDDDDDLFGELEKPKEFTPEPEVNEPEPEIVEEEPIAEPEVIEEEPEPEIVEEEVEEIVPEPVEEVPEEPEFVEEEPDLPEPEIIEEEPIPEPIEEEIEEMPEVIKPQTTEEIDSDGLDINMDYTRPEPEKPDLDAMSEADMKKYLSKRASYVKPYLSLAKELEVNINHAKKLIAKAVAKSKEGDIKMAILIMNEGINHSEDEFHRKIASDIEAMAGVIRDLKMTGTDVSGAVDLLRKAKENLEEGEIIKSVETMRSCLETVEAIAQV